MDLEDVIFMGTCVLCGVIGHYNGKNTLRQEIDDTRREDELSKLRAELNRMKSTYERASSSS